MPEARSKKIHVPREERKEDVKNGTLQVNKYLSYEPKRSEQIIKEHQVDTDEWYLDSYWSKQKSSGLWLVSALFKKKRQGDLTKEDVDKIVKKIFKDLRFNKATRQYPKISNGKALFMYISDRHIAASVKGSMYGNDYNYFTYEARMKLLLNEVFYLTSVYGSFEDIYVIDLGDKMDGWDGFTTRKNHKLPQNLSNREAFEVAIATEKGFYNQLFFSKAAKNYHIIQNSNSNHGGDFDYIVNRAIEEYVNAKFPFVKTRHLQQFIEHLVYGKHTLLLTHGKDTEDLKHGLPLHLNDKTENYVNKYLRYNKIDPDKTKVRLVKGDLHNETSQLSYGFRYKNVLSLFGGSKWIHNNFGPNNPGVSFDIIEKNTSRVYEHNLLFD